MSVPVPSTPTNPADLELRDALATFIAGWLWGESDGHLPESEFVGQAGRLADELHEQVVAPVLEGLHAELDRAVPDAIAELIEFAHEARRIGWAEDRSEEYIRHWGAVAGWLRSHLPAGHPLAYRRAVVETDEEAEAHASRPSVSDQTPATSDGKSLEDQLDATLHRAEKIRADIQTVRDEERAIERERARLRRLIRERDENDAAPSSVQGDTTPPHEVALLRQAAKAAREHGNELRADVFEVAAKDHEDDDCPKGERAECMAVELARKALAEYATSAPPEGDTTPEEDQPKPRVWHKGDVIPADVMTVKDGDGDTLTRELDPKYKGERMWRGHSKPSGNGFAWREDYLLDRWGALSEVLATSAPSEGDHQ